MSTEVTTGAGAPNETPGTTTPPPVIPLTYYQTVMGDRIKALWEFASTLPKLEFGHPDDLDFIRTHKNVSVESLETVVSNIEQTPELQTATRLEIEATRDDLQVMQAYRPMIIELEKLLSAAKYTYDARRARVTGRIQESAGITKAIARMRGANHVAAAYATIKRALKRKKKTPEEKPPIVN